jgi:hypothetical protein
MAPEAWGTAHLRGTLVSRGLLLVLPCHTSCIRRPLLLGQHTLKGCRQRGAGICAGIDGACCHNCGRAASTSCLLQPLHCLLPLLLDRV